MTYTEFGALVVFSSDLKTNDKEVVLQVSVKRRDNSKVVAKVNARLDIQINQTQLFSASVQGTPEPVSWDTLVIGARRMLFYHVLANFKIQDVRDLNDTEIESVLNEGN